MADGEHDAFEQFCAQLSGPIYGTALAVVRDRAHAEEVTQEVLTEIWLLAFRYDSGRGSPAVWALTIARRRAIDRSVPWPPRPHLSAGLPWPQLRRTKWSRQWRRPLKPSG
jgi:hypothetical protein